MSSARYFLSLALVTFGAGVLLGVIAAEWNSNRKPTVVNTRDLCVQVAHKTRTPTLYVPERGCLVFVSRQPKKEIKL